MPDTSGSNPQPSIPCGECSMPSFVVTGEKIYPHRPDLYTKNFWRCETCGAYCGCHKDSTEPLGTPAGKLTRQARSAAHRLFDRLWKSKQMTRTQAYKWLREKMGMTGDECHIAKMTGVEAGRVVMYVRKREK